MYYEDDPELDARIYLYRRLLSKGYRTEKQIREILRKKFRLSNKQIDEIVDEAKEVDLINDEEFAEVFINSKVNKGYGSKYIKNKLKEKGVEINYEIIPDFDKVLRIVKRRYGRGLESSNYNKKRKTLLRIRNFLYYRGFSSEEIKYIISKL